jgi:hypothetical protein
MNHSSSFSGKSELDLNFGTSVLLEAAATRRALLTLAIVNGRDARYRHLTPLEPWDGI